MVMVDDLTGACFDPPVDPPRWITTFDQQVEILMLMCYLCSSQMHLVLLFDK